MVMLHELGHFVTAKWSGMKVTEYFLGFGPRLWSFRRGETEYGVKALPLGGYVKIIGMSNLEEVPPEDESRTYRQQAVPQPPPRRRGRQRGSLHPRPAPHLHDPRRLRAGTDQHGPGAGVVTVWQGPRAPPGPRASSRATSSSRSTVIR